MSIWKYEYDDKHFQTKATAYLNDSLECYELIRNDDKGNVVEEQWFNPHDTCYLRRTHKYDDAGRELEQMDYNKKGMNDEKYTYVYDEKGNETNWDHEYYDEMKSSVKYRCEYTYDATGNWIEMKYYVNNDLSSKEVRIIEYYK